jgi:hypothetical protein
MYPSSVHYFSAAHSSSSRKRPNTIHAPAIAALKTELKRQRQALNETDARYPRIQGIIDKHWND